MHHTTMDIEMKNIIIKTGSYRFGYMVLLMALILSCSPVGMCIPFIAPITTEKCEWIKTSEDDTHFVGAESGTEFVIWGVNYDHNRSGQLIEDYWHEEWSTVEEDFKEIKSLGANVVRIHLQTARFIESPQEPNTLALKQLANLVDLAEKTGLYLDITGLGCYHKKDVPKWYDAMEEDERWALQALFWSIVAKTCAHSPAVFCYNLMNEPILPGKERETEWLAGEFGGKHFVQRISLDLAGRSREQVAKDWVNTLVAAIREHDHRHLITVGVIPWVHTWPQAKPLFYAKEVSRYLDFVSVHFYPKTGEVDKALTALRAYKIGKPLIVEEMFPLACSADELVAFVDGSRDIAAGWISFYWGKTIEEYAAETDDLPAAITKEWLERFRDHARPRHVVLKPHGWLLRGGTWFVSNRDTAPLPAVGHRLSACITPPTSLL
jgi:hypothetical protein